MQHDELMRRVDAIFAYEAERAKDNPTEHAEIRDRLEAQRKALKALRDLWEQPIGKHHDENNERYRDLVEIGFCNLDENTKGALNRTPNQFLCQFLQYLKAGELMMENARAAFDQSRYNQPKKSQPRKPHQSRTLLKLIQLFEKEGGCIFADGGEYTPEFKEFVNRAGERLPDGLFSNPERFRERMKDFLSTEG